MRTDLLPKLKKLEGERRRMRRRIYLIWGVAFLGIGIALFALLDDFLDLQLVGFKDSGVLFFMMLFIAPIVAYIFHWLLAQSFEEKVLLLMLERFCVFLNWDIQKKPDLERNVITWQAQLILPTPRHEQRLSSRWKMQGRYRDQPVSVAEVKIENREPYRRNGKTEYRTQTLFHGWVLNYELKGPSAGRLYCVPSHADQWLDPAAQGLAKFTPHLSRGWLKRYYIYTDQPGWAEGVLRAPAIDRLSELANLPGNLDLAFAIDRGQLSLGLNLRRHWPDLPPAALPLDNPIYRDRFLQDMALPVIAIEAVGG